MPGKINNDISGTAFVVNYSRSKRVDISKDLYANLWVTPESISLWDELAENVYAHDDINLSVRNRFFLERAKKFIEAQKKAVFISIGAGFDNYPFLLPAECRWAEFDLPNIMEFKKKKVAQWTHEGRLPSRSIEFIPVDLNNKEQRIGMARVLKKVIKTDPSFVIMEGLTYYLDQMTLTDIFKILKDIQAKGSQVAFDYWRPDALEFPVMVKLKSYLDKKFGSSGRDWYLFDEKYIKDIDGYSELDSVDISKLETEYSETRLLQGKDNKIPDNFCLLLRK